MSRFRAVDADPTADDLLDYLDGLAQLPAIENVRRLA